MTIPTISVVRPRAGTVRTSYTGREVAEAYNMIPSGIMGKSATIGYIELGGGIDPAELERYLNEYIPPPANGGTVDLQVVLVDGAKNSPDGPNGADGEVLLDVEVGVSVAPGAKHRVYFAPNTDAGFLEAIQRAGQECDIISISWGGPEDQWTQSALRSFSATFKALRAKGVKVFCASGDQGSRDGEGRAVTDYPASDPNVVACGGTQLRVNSNGSRASEVAWDDDDASSASGGGVSKVFPGRQVPDVAGNASPATGYDVLVDGKSFIIGGTSAVAPLYAGFAALVHEATSGLAYDFLNTVVTNPQTCFDVTSGDNGDYRAGPGRDQVTGFGVVDGAKFLAALNSGIPVPVPPAPPVPAPAPPVVDHTVTLTGSQYDALQYWASAKLYSGTAAAKRAWKAATA
jgi:kumamolisin